LVFFLQFLSFWDVFCIFYFFSKIVAWIAVNFGGNVYYKSVNLTCISGGTADIS
jgi:hypothetical protein